MKNDRFAWPVLLLLLTALVPSLGVVWMMREAVNNDRLAANQRLADAYRAQLQSTSEIVRTRWQIDLESLQQAVDPAAPARSFAKIISMGKCDSVAIEPHTLSAETHSDADPAVIVSAETNDTVFENAAWRSAEKLEFRSGQFADAAKQYKTILSKKPNGIAAARARESMARCLIKAGRKPEAIEVLVEQSKSATLDEKGRSFAANAEMRLLQILSEDSPIRTEIADALTQRLNDYESLMTAQQRYFLMNEVVGLMPQGPDFPSRTAERIASEYFDSTPATQRPTDDKQLHPSVVDDLWQQTSPDGSLTALWSTKTVSNRIAEICNEIPLPTGVRWVAIEPGVESESLVNVSLAPTLVPWKLGIATDHDHESVVGAKSRSTVYIWITLLIVATTALLAWILSGVVRKRLELAEQKNNLVANVSHELKTPLASIRLLVDTLLMNQESAGGSTATSQQSEYLQLIAQENTRLTRLINNFLTFSKMDQGSPRFDLHPVSLAAVAKTAIGVFGDRTPAAGESIKLTVVEECWVKGDVDALVTALVNLLENAWKYNSKAHKEIRISVEHAQTHATVSVSDNGMGMSARATRKIFERFYQANDLMTRQQGGCGLGLSIVKAIVESHGGGVTVKSKPDAGTTFTISIPLAERTTKATAEKTGSDIDE